jgi:glutathione S-transferase
MVETRAAGGEHMKLYGGMLSPFVMRVVLAARAKGLELANAMPEGGLKSPEFLALNPIGKMPTLVEGDFALPESEVIAQYLDEAFPHTPLMPADPKGRARVRLVSRLCDVYLVPNLSPLFQGAQGEARQTALEGFAKGLDYLEHFMGPGPNAVGDQFSLADCTLIPVFFFLDVFQASDATADRVAERPKVAAWWKQAKASPLGAWAVAEQGKAFQSFMVQRASQN